MDQQLEDIIVEEVDDLERREVIEEIIRFEKSKLGQEHRKGREDKIRPLIQEYLREKGEIP